MSLIQNKVNKLDILYDVFNTPLICRVQNKVTLNRYDSNSQFILSLDRDNTTTLIPLGVGAPTSMLKTDQRMYFLVRNKTELTFSECSFEHAKICIEQKPLLVGNSLEEIACSIEQVINNSLMSDTIPDINKKDPDNWVIFLRIFIKQRNNIMAFFLSHAMCKFDELLKN
jgi:hypothetical protein